MKVVITTNKLINLADAVRTHNAISDKLKLPDIPGMLWSEKPGTYDAQGNMLKSWPQLLEAGDVLVENGVLTTPVDISDAAHPIETYKDGPRIRMSDAKKIVFPEDVIAIGGEETFRYCDNLETIIFQGNIQRIGDYAFSDCTKLSNIQMPNSLLSIGVSAFGVTNIKDIEWVPNTIQTVAGLAFAATQIGPDITLKDFWIKILNKKESDFIFQGCDRIENVYLPEGLTYLPAAFVFCKNLKTVTIPDSVTDISSNAFLLCSKLTKIYYKGTATGAPWGATNATVITDF